MLTNKFKYLSENPNQAKAQEIISYFSEYDNLVELLVWEKFDNSYFLETINKLKKMALEVPEFILPKILKVVENFDYNYQRLLQEKEYSRKHNCSLFLVDSNNNGVYLGLDVFLVYSDVDLIRRDYDIDYCLTKVLELLNNELGTNIDGYIKNNIIKEISGDSASLGILGALLYEIYKEENISFIKEYNQIAFLSDIDRDGNFLKVNSIIEKIKLAIGKSFNKIVMSVENRSEVEDYFKDSTIERIYFSTVGDFLKYFTLKTSKDDYVRNYIKYDLSRCIGRNQYSEKLHKLLTESKTRILAISSMGGMGKTTVALNYINNNNYNSYFKNILWITVGNRALESLVTNPIFDKLNYIYRNDMDLSMNLNRLIGLLNNQAGNNLLIFDNVDNIQDILEIKNNCKDLGENWKIIITTRTNPKFISEIIYLSNLNKEESFQLFDYYFKKEKALSNRLEFFLEKLGGHPLLIEMVAKYGQNNIFVENTNDLLDIIENSYISSQDNFNIITGLPSNEKYAPIKDTLLEIFKLEKLNKEEKAMLVMYSLYPPINFSLFDLAVLFGMNSKEEKVDLISILEELVNKGLIINEEDFSGSKTYKCHQLIIDFTLENIELSEYINAKLWENLTLAIKNNRLINKGIYNNKELLVYFYNVCENQKLNSFDLATLEKELSIRFKLLGDFDKALKRIDSSISRLKKLSNREINVDILLATMVKVSILWRAKKISNNRVFALIENVEEAIERENFDKNIYFEQYADYLLAKISIYRALKNYSFNQLKCYFDMGIIILKNNKSKNPIVSNILLGEFYNDMAFILLNEDTQDINIIKCYLDNSKEIREPYLNSEHSVFAVLYNNYATFYNKTKEWNMAIEFAEKAKLLRIKYNNNDFFRFEKIYFNLAKSYLGLGKTMEAKKFCQKSIDIFKDYYVDNHILIEPYYQLMLDISTILNDNELITKTEKILKEL